MSKLGYLRSERGAYSQNRGGDDIVENIRVTLRHNSSNENNGPVFVRINVGLQFVFRIYRPNCPRLFLNGNCNNFYNSRTCWANSLQSSQLYESLNIKIVTGVGNIYKYRESQYCNDDLTNAAKTYYD